jgi:hypothetical protein
MSVASLLQCNINKNLHSAIGHSLSQQLVMAPEAQVAIAPRHELLTRAGIIGKH